MSADSIAQSALVQGAMSAVQNKAVPNPRATANVAAATKASKDFEAVFISEFMGSMFEGISTDGPFGGGQGEAMFRSLMLDQYGRAMADRGGFGIADAVKASLLKTQEARP